MGSYPFSIQWGLASGQVPEEEMGASCVGKKRKIATGTGASKRQGHQAKEDALCSHRRVNCWSENAEKHCERSERRRSQALSLGKEVSTFPAVWLPFPNSTAGLICPVKDI